MHSQPHKVEHPASWLWRVQDLDWGNQECGWGLSSPTLATVSTDPRPQVSSTPTRSRRRSSFRPIAKYWAGAIRRLESLTNMPGVWPLALTCGGSSTLTCQPQQELASSPWREPNRHHPVRFNGAYLTDAKQLSSEEGRKPGPAPTERMHSLPVGPDYWWLSPCLFGQQQPELGMDQPKRNIA